MGIDGNVLSHLLGADATRTLRRCLATTGSTLFGRSTHGNTILSPRWGFCGTAAIWTVEALQRGFEVEATVTEIRHGNPEITL